jgi:uncharacterized membrane protein
MWTMQQMPSSWHHQGLYMGMHWLWWLFWLLVVLLVAWAFWRLVRDERERDRETSRREAAEEILRRRFSEGEIEEEELLHGIRLLRESRSSHRGRSPAG